MHFLKFDNICLYIDDAVVCFKNTQSYTHMKRCWQPKKEKRSRREEKCC